MDEMLRLLASEYGIVSDHTAPAVGGFSARAFRVKGSDGTDFFVKAYDKSRPTTRFFTERIANYMPVLDRLVKSPALRGRILTPILTKYGTYMAETDTDVYVLFLFVHGESPGVRGMTRAQTAELAEILALLHSVGENIPIETHGLDEDISLAFCEQLARFIDDSGAKSDALAELISPHAGLLRSAVKQALHLRDTVRLGYSPLVLCHGDAHGNNVIQSERLVLADWEDLRRAPVEADLFIHAWHPHGGVLLEAYAAARNGYRIDRELLYFYVLRRRIEDVWVDIQRMTEETPDEAETEKLLDDIQQGIAEVRALCGVQRTKRRI